MPVEDGPNKPQQTRRATMWRWSDLDYLWIVERVLWGVLALFWLCAVPLGWVYHQQIEAQRRLIVAYETNNPRLIFHNRKGETH